MQKINQLLVNTWRLAFAGILFVVTAPVFFLVDYHKLVKFANKYATGSLFVASVIVLACGMFKEYPLRLTAFVLFSGYLWMTQHDQELFN